MGDLVLDVVAAPVGPIAPGSDVAGSVTFRAGGSAANTARAVARHGGRSTFVGAVGDDGLGRRLVASLRSEGVTVRRVSTDRPTARLVALVGADGERSFVTDRGAADELRASHLRPAWFRGVDALHLPAYSLMSASLWEAALAAASMARALGQAAISVDLASSAPLRSLGRTAARERIGSLAPDLLFGTTAEVAAIATDEAELLDLAPLVVVKAGDAGCRVLVCGDGRVRSLEVMAPRLRAADSTGAGDAFDAGFLLSWLPDRDHSAAALRRAASAGHRAAAAVLTGPRVELGL